MKTLILFICFSWSLTGFTQTNLSKAPFNDTTFAILEIDTTNYCSGKLTGYLQDEFNADNLSLIDSLLRPFIAERTNPGYPFHCSQEIHDYPYYYQFIAIKSNTGEKMIWVNAFCPHILKIPNTLTKHEQRQLKKGKKLVSQESDNWHKYIICAFDGCGCFWELKINLTTKSVFDIQISGM